MKIGAVTFDSRNSEDLSDFYQRLLGMKKFHHSEDGSDFIGLYNENGEGPLLVFQDDPHYESPVFPSEPDLQQTMVHLDLFVTRDEFEGAIEQCHLLRGRTRAGTVFRSMESDAGPRRTSILY